MLASDSPLMAIGRIRESTCWLAEQNSLGCHYPMLLLTHNRPLSSLWRLSSALKPGRTCWKLPSRAARVASATAVGAESSPDTN
jgi:hypothetical protein